MEKANYKYLVNDNSIEQSEDYLETQEQDRNKLKS